MKAAFAAHGLDTPEFSLNGVRTYARCVDVYDGDTCKLVMSVHGRFYKFPVRLHGIDCSELTSRDDANKARAVAARDRLIQLVTNAAELPRVKTKKDVRRLLDDDVHVVWVECFQHDRYGRVLANLYAVEGDTVSFSDVLVEERLAYGYSGDAKLSEEAQNASLS